jgi:hypothetical protein
MNCREFGVARHLKRTKNESSKVADLGIVAGLPCAPESIPGWTNGGGLSAERSSIGATAARQK